MKSAQDQKEASEVLRFVQSNYHGSPQPKLYCSGGSRSTHIDIYGVSEPAEQDAIVALIRTEITNRDWKQIYLVFRDREHFVAQDNGWQKRDGERDLYSIIVAKP